MEKTYNSNIEKAIYETWEKENVFAPSNKGESYCIQLPPPNVTGNLHMGHGFQHTLMDALTRYHRMCGANTLWQPGMDHAGIATQMVVERKLASENKTRHDVGREKFVEAVWQWKNESGDKILQQMRRLGVSVDWPQARFTMDEHMVKAVQKAFIDLYHEGLIYRGKRLVNWDPVLHTAISDLEVNNEEEPGNLWHIRYPFGNGNEYLIVATTRPETMLGDTAIAVHPEDVRYKKLIGQKVKLPLTDREIPVIADEYVDPEFGTGCVKITPAHDFNDYAIGQRHNLDMINILTIDAKLNKNAPQKYQGMDRFEARKQIVEDLKSQNLLEKIEDYKIKVPRGDRSKTIIEPYLTDQWFVKVEPLAKPAIEAVESGKIKFIPETWSKTYFQWMRNIQDWCISRQLWWGHRIPAWYDENGKIYVGHNEDEIREKNKLSADIKLTQDEDVLDTWFSSALWPFSTLGWPETTERLKIFYPSNVLVTGFDIIFFWVARMIMFGLKFMNDVPFREVYIHGLIRDPEGHKMSKSKGNILDPIDLIDGISLEKLMEERTVDLMQPEMKSSIEKMTREQFPDGIAAHGTDALRMTFTSLASPSRDIIFDLGRLEGYRNFCNKLWNATRYVLMNTESKSLGDEKTRKLSVADQWIHSRLQKVIILAHEQFKTYRFDLLTQVLHEFTWGEFCDWYLELSKVILTGESSEEEKQGTRFTLLNVLETLLRLLHPIIPFVTESLYQSIIGTVLKMGTVPAGDCPQTLLRGRPLISGLSPTIMLAPYPKTEKSLINNALEAELEWIQAMILAIRNIRGEMNIAPGKKIPVLLAQGQAIDKNRLEKYHAFVKILAKCESIEFNESPPESATALVGELKLYIPLEGLIDKKAEIERLQKEIIKIEKELSRCQSKLNNKSFVDKAPKEVVAQEQQRVTDWQTKIETLKTQLEKYQ